MVLFSFLLSVVVSATTKNLYKSPSTNPIFGYCEVKIMAWWKKAEGSKDSIHPDGTTTV